MSVLLDLINSTHVSNITIFDAVSCWCFGTINAFVFASFLGLVSNYRQVRQNLPQFDLHMFHLTMVTSWWNSMKFDSRPLVAALPRDVFVAQMGERNFDLFLIIAKYESYANGCRLWTLTVVSFGWYFCIPFWIILVYCSAVSGYAALHMQTPWMFPYLEDGKTPKQFVINTFCLSFLSILFEGLIWCIGSSVFVRLLVYFGLNNQEYEYECVA